MPKGILSIGEYERSQELQVTSMRNADFFSILQILNYKIYSNYW